MARRATTHEESSRDEGESRRPTAGGERYRLEGTYERLRRALLAGPDDGRVDRSLSFWVLPTDKRLPLAFLDRTPRDLLSRPLDELMRTPGVGRKKILGFFELLRRAVKSEGFDSATGVAAASTAALRRRGVVVEPSGVSEAVWREWCDAILRAGFGRHPLGRVAPSLRPLPTVIWGAPLEDYAACSLADIRALRTHGEKRVNAIIEVFGAVYEAVSTAALHEELQLDLTPRFVPSVTGWVVRRLGDDRPIGFDEARDAVARPLARQIDVDRGSPVTEIVAERLGIPGPAPTVRSQAERLGVTRARVYQLLEECADVMAVRWPEGRWILAPLFGRAEDSEALGLLHAVRATFYP